MTIDPFAGPGNWYKGNLHCHSTKSDGMMTYDELKTAFKERGYSFVAFSDHNQFLDTSFLSDPDFLALPAVELGIVKTPTDIRDFHFNGVMGTDEMLEKATLPMLKDGEWIGPVPFTGYECVQGMVDSLVKRGFFVTVNHPHWSLNEIEDILPLKGLNAMEVFNYSSHHVENMGDDKVIWGSLLRRGMRLWGLATDDNHDDFALDAPDSDLGGGWVCVKAPSLSRNDIVQALVDGRFYASSGPTIHSFRIEDNKVIFECSPCEKMYINGDVRQYVHRIGEPHQDTVTCLRKKLLGTEKYVRGECVDRFGRRAYSNPIFLG